MKKNPTDATVYQNFIIPYLYEAQHVSGDTVPLIRSLKLHWQPLVFHTWKVVGHVVGGCCQAHTVPDNIHQSHVQQPWSYVWCGISVCQLHKHFYCLDYNLILGSESRNIYK